MAHHIVCMDAKIKSDHAEILRVSRELENFTLRTFPRHLEKNTHMSRDIQTLAKHSFASQTDRDRECKNVSDCVEKVNDLSTKVTTLRSIVQMYDVTAISSRFGINIEIESLKRDAVAQESRTDDNYTDTLHEQSRICRVMDLLNNRLTVVEAINENTPVNAAQAAAL